jgi:hypothetical protein
MYLYSYKMIESKNVLMMFLSKFVPGGFFIGLIVQLLFCFNSTKAKKFIKYIINYIKQFVYAFVMHKSKKPKSAKSTKSTKSPNIYVQKNRKNTSST